MIHTEQTFLEINISGENAKEDALGKITGFVEQNLPNRVLQGLLVGFVHFSVVTDFPF